MANNQLRARGLVIGVGASGQSSFSPKPPPKPLPYSAYGLVSIVWGGANKSIAILNTADYARVSGLAEIMGTIKGIVSNADGSFTNNGAAALDVTGLITVQGYFAGNYTTNLTAGLDSGGGGAAIITSSGSWAPTTQLGDGPVTFWSSYQIALQPGETVFPMIRNASNTNPFLVSTGKHLIRSVNNDS